MRISLSKALIKNLLEREILTVEDFEGRNINSRFLFYYTDDQELYDTLDKIKTDFTIEYRKTEYKRYYNKVGNKKDIDVRNKINYYNKRLEIVKQKLEENVKAYDEKQSLRSKRKIEIIKKINSLLEPKPQPL